MALFRHLEWIMQCDLLLSTQENLIFCSSKTEYDFPGGDVTSTLERRKTNPHSTVSLKCWEFIRPDTVECAYLLPRCVSFWAWTSFCQELQHRVWGNKIEPLSKVVWVFFFKQPNWKCIREAFLCGQTSEHIFNKMDNLWALTLKQERLKVGSKTRAIDKSDEVLDMEPREHQAENIWVRTKFKYIWH